MSDLDDLDAMFPDLDSTPDPDALPELQRQRDFASGVVFRNEPPPSTDVALVAVFERVVCLSCQSDTLRPLGWAVKRKHHSRNPTTEYQFIMPSALPLYRCLPKLHKVYPAESTFCRSCYLTQGFEDEDE